VNETAFEYWAKSPTDTQVFNTFMTGVRGSRPHWVHWFPVQEKFIDGSSGKVEDVLLVDVGGGKGHDLNKFIESFPDAKGRYVLEDLPYVIDDTYDRNSRIEALKHDFFQEQPVQGANPRSSTLFFSY
jgi:O-methyltransferase domain